MNILQKIDKINDETDMMVSLIICGVLISSGIIMLVDHRGMTDEDVTLFNILGVIFLIGGTLSLILWLTVAKQTLKRLRMKNGSES